MNKKKAFLISGIVFALIGATAVAISSGNDLFTLSAGGSSYTHVVRFETATNMAYDSENDVYTFDTSALIKDSDNNDQTVLIEDVSIYYSKTEPVYNSGCLASFEVNAYTSIEVLVSLVKKATIDLDSSTIDLYVYNGDSPTSSDYRNAKFELFDEEDTTWNSYLASFDFGKYYGYKAQITDIKLTFDCPR